MLAHVASALATDAALVEGGDGTAAKHELGGAVQLACLDWQRAQVGRVAAEARLESWPSEGHESQWYQLDNRFGIALSAISVGEREQAATALDSLLAIDPVGVVARRANVLAAALRGAPSSELVALADQQAKEAPGPELERARYALALDLLGMSDLDRGDAERARLMKQHAYDAQGELSWANVVRLPR